ncbi:MAG: hypothetical protein HYX96_05845 [Chloroflexi bacterium]|nr:hypothetical protein [Chloroflexota bacterium]
MESEERLIEPPVRLPGLVIIPVARVLRRRGRRFVLGVKQPVGLVLITGEGRRAFRVSGEEVAVADLVAETPALAEALSREML